MPSVELDATDWNMIVNILASTKEWPWTVTNPLLMRLSSQLQPQHGNSQQMPAAQAEVGDKQHH